MRPAFRSGSSSVYSELFTSSDGVYVMPWAANQVYWRARATYDRLGGLLPAKSLGSKQLRGRREPLEMFEVQLAAP